MEFQAAIAKLVHLFNLRLFWILLIFRLQQFIIQTIPTVFTLALIYTWGYKNHCRYIHTLYQNSHFLITLFAIIIIMSAIQKWKKIVHACILLNHKFLTFSITLPEFFLIFESVQSFRGFLTCASKEIWLIEVCVICCLLSKPKVRMTSLCSTEAPDCRTGQSKGRYRKR